MEKTFRTTSWICILIMISVYFIDLEKEQESIFISSIFILGNLYGVAAVILDEINKKK